MYILQGGFKMAPRHTDAHTHTTVLRPLYRTVCVSCWLFML